MLEAGANPAICAARPSTALKSPWGLPHRLMALKRGFLVWGLSRSLLERRQIVCPSSVSLFDLKARFFVPTRGSLTSSRAAAVKVGRHASFAACSELARPYLDSFEHDGTLGAVGMTIGGEPAFGRGSVAPQPCIRSGPRTRTMMQSYASAAKLRSGGPILPFGIESQGNTSGLRHLEPSSATRHQDGPG